MTKEEAIEILQELDGRLYETQQKAVDMAIKSLEQQPSEDCVSRKFMYELGATCIATRDKNDKLIALGTIENLPPVTPKLSTCKDCKWWDSENNKIGYCNACKHGHWSGTWDIGIYRKTKADFYCADFEKKGNEDGSN